GAGGLASSGIAINRERLEQIKRNESARRRAAALGTENTARYDFMPRDPYQGAPGHRPAQERKSMPMSYSTATSASAYPRPLPAAAATAVTDRLYEGRPRLAHEQKPMTMPYRSVAISDVYPRPR
ncbi:hypothetical protein IWQ56_003515, partial [Coemansia nantahalensis]